MNSYMKNTPLIRLGTRGSRLAIAQAHEFQKSLEKACELFKEPNSIEIVVIKTTGDKVQDRFLSEIGGKGLFMKEIEEALLENRIDVALHSIKDMESVLTPGTKLSCVLPREEINDAFISNRATSLAELPYASVIGTSSARRAALIKNKRADLKTVLFRGNIDTRLEKLDSGNVDATLLAVAGLKRIGLKSRITQLLDLEDMPPALGQGAIGAQCRSPKSKADNELAEWLDTINHEESAIRIKAERAMLAKLGGTCQTPIAGFTNLINESEIELNGYVVSVDGSRLYKVYGKGLRSEAIQLGDSVGERLLLKAGADFPGQL